jgi:hypothetical protein
MMDYSQAVETYVGRLVDFTKEVILQLDIYNQTYIEQWNISGIPEPTQQEILNLMQDDYQLDKVFETKTYTVDTFDSLSLISANNNDIAYVQDSGKNYVYIFGSGWHEECMSLWENWNPTITYDGNELSGTIVVTARYTKLKKIVFFDININSTNGNNVSKIYITLPTLVANSKTIIASIENIDGDIVYGSKATINGNNEEIVLENLTQNSIGLGYEITINGRYEAE